MDSAQAAQRRRKTLTPENLAIERDVTRKSLVLIPMADLQAMKADHKRQEKRDKHRADAKGSVADPLEIDNDDDEEENDNDNDKGEDKLFSDKELFSDESNADPDKGAYRDPDDNDPGGYYP